MTIYQFNRQGKGLVKTRFSIEGYIIFTLYLFIFSILEVINLPKIFNFNFHFFIFELSLIYLLIIKNYKILYFTILFFYLMLDAIGGVLIGNSFIAFLLSFGIINFIIKQYKNSLQFITPAFFSLCFTIFLTLFISIQSILLFIFSDFTFNLEVLKYIIKSVSINALICLNFSIIFKNLLFENKLF